MLHPVCEVTQARAGSSDEWMIRPQPEHQMPGGDMQVPGQCSRRASAWRGLRGVAAT